MKEPLAATPKEADLARTRAILAGDKEAFARLYEESLDRLHTLVFCGNMDDLARQQWRLHRRWYGTSRDIMAS